MSFMSIFIYYVHSIHIYLFTIIKYCAILKIVLRTTAALTAIYQFIIHVQIDLIRLNRTDCLINNT